jgi:hypothetical protein
MAFGGDGPGVDLVPITPSDSVDLAEQARALRCSPGGAAGTVRFVTSRGNTRNTSIALGELLPVQCVRVHSTGTTATGLEAVI